MGMRGDYARSPQWTVHGLKSGEYKNITLLVPFTQCQNPSNAIKFCHMLRMCLWWPRQFLSAITRDVYLMPLNQYLNFAK